MIFITACSELLRKNPHAGKESSWSSSCLAKDAFSGPVLTKGLRVHTPSSHSHCLHSCFSVGYCGEPLPPTPHIYAIYPCVAPLHRG